MPFAFRGVSHDARILWLASKEFVMLSAECARELRTAWMPNLTDPGLDRLIELLEKGSPFLIHGCFTKTAPMGCLASHAD
jgi:hypothetical protein